MYVLAFLEYTTCFFFIFKVKKTNYPLEHEVNSSQKVCFKIDCSMLSVCIFLKVMLTFIFQILCRGLSTQGQNETVSRDHDHSAGLVM